MATAWSDPQRAYHGTTHLVDCLEQLDAAPGEGADRRIVEAALWFHDAVYDPRATGNEARSAAWASRALGGVGIPGGGGTRGRAARSCSPATPHPRPTRRPPHCDVDLSILGRDPDEFYEFERRIRAEYAWVPEATYRAVRAEILTGFLHRSPLFLTQPFPEEVRVGGAPQPRGGRGPVARSVMPVTPWPQRLCLGSPIGGTRAGGPDFGHYRDSDTYGEVTT